MSAALWVLLVIGWGSGSFVATQGAEVWASEEAPVRAQEEEAVPPVHVSEDVVVTATRTRQSLREVSGSPTVLTPEDIERSPFRGGHQTDDLLRYVPSSQPSNLSSRYNHPTAQAISLRGLGSRRALVLLDGVPLNDGFGGWINWGLVPDDIARIEVVPGGGSNLYGTWAMGGIVQIFTEPAMVAPQGRSTSSAGNLSTFTQSLLGSYGTDRAGLSLGYRWYHTNGYITVPDDQRGPVDRTNDSRHQQFNGKAAVALSARTRLTASGYLFREDRHFGTPLSVASRTIGGAAVGLDGETPRGDDWTAKLYAQGQTFRNNTSQVTPQPTVRLGEVPARYQTITSNDFGGSGQWAGTILPGHRLVVGTDVRAILGQSEEDLFDATGQPAGFSLAKGKQVGWGVFGEWVATVTEQLTLTPSVRWDWWKTFDGRRTTASGGPTALPDNVLNVVNPKLALRYQLVDRVQLGAAVYQAFRVPTLNELYRDFAFGGFTFASNPDLEPERLRGGEAKIEADLLPGGRLTLRVTGHYNEVNDLILFITQSSTTAQRQNVGRIQEMGTELEVQARLQAWLLFTGGYAYTDSTIQSFPADTTREGNQVPNVSRHQVTLRATLGAPELAELSLLGRYLSRQYADDRNTQPIMDVFLLDASLRKRFGRHVQLFLDAENLTDEEYLVTQTGPVKTLGPPRLVVGGVTLEF